MLPDHSLQLVSLLAVYDGHDLHGRARRVVCLAAAVQGRTVLRDQLMLFIAEGINTFSIIQKTV